jgi:ribose 5-phosphate isomerase B
MVALACDHVALELKEEIKTLLDELGYAYTDFGTCGVERTDYPVYAARAARAIASGVCEKGILCCGTGVGMSIAANKIKGIRCVVCSDCYSAKLSREHNDTNMLSMGARVVGGDLAKMIARIWLTTEYEGGRHQRRLNQIAVLEAQGDIE